MIKLKKFEDRLTKNCLEYKREIEKTFHGHEWSSFAANSIPLIDAMLSSIYISLKNFNVKFSNINQKKWDKNIRNMSNNDFVYLVKFMLFDYFCYLKTYDDLLLRLYDEKLSIRDVETELFKLFMFNDHERKMYDEYKASSHLVKHSVDLLNHIGLKGQKVSNDSVIGIIDLFKEESFAIVHRRFNKVVMPNLILLH